MNKTFEYSAVVQTEEEIDIENIGNCSIIANDVIGKNWCLIIQTSLGFTDIFEFGPMFESGELPNSIKFTYNRIPYDDKKISRYISNFLNRKDGVIIQARQVELEEAKSIIINLGDLIYDERND